MKHFLKATLLFLVLAALLFVFLHTTLSYGESLAAASLFCDTHAHLSLRLTLPYAVQGVGDAVRTLWDSLPPTLTHVPSLLWENAARLLAGGKAAFEGDLCGCVALD